ncbi:MAG: type II toxin-antitoxin system prevent-host-death family antitoxin [Ignavibacteriaceae bacterium]|nr:type II toxin-antitoxin system prevent-host-death family antitoxin [Ignavibacteriaceae bacterium]
MKDINVANDIIPVGEFKARMAQYLKMVQENGNSLVLTQNGKPAGVLLSPAEFDELRKTKLFVESVARGLTDSEKGDVLTTDQLKVALKKGRSK